jgi:hypothetical protein
MAKTTPTPPAAQAQGAAPAHDAIEVLSKRESFWRGGIKWTSQPRVVPLADLTEQQLELITAEGNPGGQLVVRFVNLADLPSARG